MHFATSSRGEKVHRGQFMADQGVFGNEEVLDPDSCTQKLLCVVVAFEMEGL